MFCNKCGKEVPETTKFCPYCGADCSTTSRAADQVLHKAEKELDSAIDEVRADISGNNQGQAAGNGSVPPQGGGTKLKDDRGLLAYILLTIITCGIYGYYFIYKMAHDVNIACEGDGKETAGLATFILLSIVTCSIYAWVWYYKLGNRLAENAPRYNLNIVENGTTVLMWLIFGSLICGIGQFIAMHILIKNSNMICNAYNRAHGLV